MGKMAQNLRIHAGFPGGNIIVEEYLDDAVKLRPAPGGEESTVLWWYFEAQNVAAEAFSVRFIFPAGALPEGAGPCVNCDEEGWNRLARESVEGDSFVFHFTAATGACRFAYSRPYLMADLDKFLLTRPVIERKELVRSEENRAVTLLHLPAAAPVRTVFISARQQNGSGLSNFVLEGIMDEWRNNHGILSEQVELYVLPLADTDGVEDGSPGINRPSHDPGRDYGAFRYRVSSAYIAQLQQCRDRIALVLELRPAARHETAIIWDEPSDTGDLACLNAALAMRRQGELSCDFRSSGSGSGDDGCAAYVRSALQLPNAFTLAIPAAVADGIVIDEDRARMLGRDLVRAIEACAAGAAAS
ncbi:MAG: M14-type cytosolic carboxypeptidase [Victivallales bacterium]|nr:M14-type cytosolic carboxypeptidase [Victivallales bacterium]